MLRVNDLLHRPNDFVALVTRVDEKLERVYLEYYKWSYDNPDNASMFGWYPISLVGLYKVAPSHDFFQRHGFPPNFSTYGIELNELLETYGYCYQKYGDNACDWDEVLEAKQAVIDFIDPHKYTISDINQQVRKAAEKYAQLYHEYETGVSDDIDEDEVTTSEAVSDALDALVGRVLILARKVSSK